jgi:ABC-type antimicrobial peptide transport system permease subunit
MLTIYHPVRQMNVAGRLFVHVSSDPYALVPTVTQLVRTMSANQPVERAATLEDVRADVLAPERLNAFVVSGFAGIALLIAVVGVAGVLAFSVSARTREFGVRLAIGSSPRHLMVRVVLEGAGIVVVGIAVGALGGFAFSRLAGSFVENVQTPGVLSLLGAASVLICAALLASLMPAARASHVDVLQALRSE